MPGDVLTATIESARTLTSDVREIVLAPVNTPPLNYTPGQWISLRLPIGDRPPLIRAYTMATPPAADGRLTLCFDRIEGGLGSEYLWAVEPGNTLEFSGPLGNFILPESGDLVFVAQYTGIVPFRAMLLGLAGDDAFARSGRKVHLIYGARRREDLAYHAELRAMAATVSWLDYRPVVLEGATADEAISGSETDVLEAFAREWLPFTPMLCGIREFTFPTRALLIETFGFERRAVKVENYNGPTAR